MNLYSGKGISQQTDSESTNSQQTGLRYWINRQGLQGSYYKYVQK